jgi:hypothetical protein
MTPLNSMMYGTGDYRLLSLILPAHMRRHATSSGRCAESAEVKRHNHKILQVHTRSRRKE